MVEEDRKEGKHALHEGVMAFLEFIMSTNGGIYQVHDLKKLILTRM